jgi:hypothetical protein
MTIKNSTVTREQYDRVVEGKAAAMAPLHAEIKALRRIGLARQAWVAALAVLCAAQSIAIALLVFI